MNKKFEEEMFEKYNRFFPAEDIRKDEMQSCLARGFECGEGWRKLLGDFFEELDKINLPINFLIEQIKEKFGRLRIYTSISSNEIENLIHKYEKRASITCENCGHENAKLRDNNNWLVTLCDKCFEIRKNK